MAGARPRHAQLCQRVSASKRCWLVAGGVPGCNVGQARPAPSVSLSSYWLRRRGRRGNAPRAIGAREGTGACARALRGLRPRLSRAVAHPYMGPHLPTQARGCLSASSMAPRALPEDKTVNAEEDARPGWQLRAVNTSGVYAWRCLACPMSACPSSPPSGPSRFSSSYAPFHALCLARRLHDCGEWRMAHTLSAQERSALSSAAGAKRGTLVGLQMLVA